MPVLVVAERDFTAVHEKMTSIGPLIEDVGMVTKGVALRRPGARSTSCASATAWCTAEPVTGSRVWRPTCSARRRSCTCPASPTATWPRSGSRTWRSAPAPSSTTSSAEHEGKQITFADTQVAPVPVITSPEWSGSESGGRRYAPFTINIERKKPFHTLTGRQQFYVDHDWFIGMGEALPVYRPPLEHVGALR